MPLSESHDHGPTHHHHGDKVHDHPHTAGDEEDGDGHGCSHAAGVHDHGEDMHLNKRSNTQGVWQILQSDPWPPSESHDHGATHHHHGDKVHDHPHTAGDEEDGDGHKCSHAASVHDHG